MLARHFLQLPSIKGDSDETNHKEWMDVESMSLGVTNDNSRAHGVPAWTDLILVRKLDKASVPLAFCCSAGRTFANAEYHVTANINNRCVVVYAVRMKTVWIKAYSVSASKDGGAVETLRLGYNEIDAEYTVRDPRTGDIKGKVADGYNIAANKRRNEED